eukprot:255311_1
MAEMMMQYKARNIIIYNRSGHVILVRVAFQKSEISSSVRHKFSSLMSSEYRGGNKGGGVSIGIPGYVSFGINANKSSAHGSSHNENIYSKSNIQMVVGAFKDEGFNCVLAKDKRNFAVQGDIAYISALDYNGNEIVHNWNVMGSSFIYNGKTLKQLEEVKEQPKVEKEQIPMCHDCGKSCNVSPAGKRLKSGVGSKTCGNKNCKRSIAIKSEKIWYHSHTFRVYFRCPYCGIGNSFTK